MPYNKRLYDSRITLCTFRFQVSRPKSSELFARPRHRPQKNFTIGNQTANKT